ncbi:syntaxin 5, putative [Plasmodium knowlesi strain H]|uniref:Syntaxin 5, putative n=3 Tax=Plasmodium knowlesi TaxID=5850 RepID=A0A5K1VGK9_PLAKH|nr:syntaxin 5, putative [Plasmodium knowlesi strain H]OTN66445.1 putative Syntaxin 5 [Plasmodium knowlesi]CAA9990004.1 syntaxin 5, putative [Plasmodium knowlesi strain H]SBO24602.1 syntaxin 5, putative [Plasmodium knowlesi strain H]SBO26240.1 syntaxin 5, putative [Plasmodium knowlesi strain H]VVS79478.1 syntaxin 5, putative [Plasmodium knowlesi strain H]|eukprot:XP_002260019.1 syntaxin 5, putative [Plasmodium knowlesi strain H]
MPYVDKTEEFFKAVERLSNENFDFRKDRNVGQDTEVNELASKITDLLHRGNQKLQQLERCVRQKGIFNDKTSQIEELTYEVKQTITDATNDVDALVQYVCDLNISNPQGKTHLDNIIFSLKNRLFEFTKKFKDVLHIRSEHIKKQVNRRNMYSYTNTESTFSNDNYKFTPLRDIDIESGQQQTLKMPEKTSYLHSRADAMENIQKIIGDLAQMFQKVATMVTQQDEMIRRIDEDIDTSLYNTREGQNYLLSYLNRLTSTRTLIIQIFACIFILIVFFVLFT